MKTLYEVDCATAPVKLKSGLAHKFVIRELSFPEFCETIGAGNGASTRAEAIKAQRAIRREKQITAFDDAGNALKIAQGELLGLPRKTYARIMGEIDNFGDAPQGDVIVEGDGIDRPVIYRLGTPIKLSDGDDGAEIKELEFAAKTGGEIEDVMAESLKASQALALILHCAKPLTKDLGLLRLPSWAVERITVSDGLTIMDKVLPGFLE